MPDYQIKIQRVTIEDSIFDIEADNEEIANSKADQILSDIQNHDGHLHSPEWELDSSSVEITEWP